MALFGSKETKEEKEERQAQELLNKYGLQNLSDQSDVDSVRKIAQELAATGFVEFSAKLGNAAQIGTLQMQYQRAIAEQNFIIIRQLDRLNRNLENK